MSRQALRLRTLAAGLFLAGTLAVIAPAAALGYCDGWHYTNVAVGSSSMVVTNGPYKNYNGTRYNQTHTFTSTTSVTVGVGLSVEAKASWGAIVASAEVTAKVDLSASLTATISNSVTMTVPPYTYANARYGVWRIYTTGHLYHQYFDTYCRTDVDYGTVVARVPRSVGWYTWLSNY
jgi:hypothetical protein